jgi:uncharacterized protein (TIGR02145 family)
MSYKFGNEPWIQIGTQKWQRRNLNVTTYRNGDIIPYVVDQTEWTNLTTGAWCWYNNDPELGKIYGKLYNWYAVSDPRGLAPIGWHVPSLDEFGTLISYLGDVFVAGSKLKSTTGWSSGGNGTNSSGFNGLPSGKRRDNFEFLNEQTYYWSTDEKNSGETAFAMYLFYTPNIASTDTNNEFWGQCVRCIKD